LISWRELFQKYRIKVTGVQASDKELARLRPLIFNLSQNPEVFLQNADDIIRELDQSASNRIGMLEAGGRDQEKIDNFEKFYFGNADPLTGRSPDSQTGTNISQGIDQELQDIEAQLQKLGG